jgi:hypothetical protein
MGRWLGGGRSAAPAPTAHDEAMDAIFPAAAGASAGAATAVEGGSEDVVQARPTRPTRAPRDVLVERSPAPALMDDDEAPVLPVALTIPSPEADDDPQTMTASVELPPVARHPSAKLPSQLGRSREAAVLSAAAVVPAVVPVEERLAGRVAASARATRPAMPSLADVTRESLATDEGGEPEQPAPGAGRPASPPQALALAAAGANWLEDSLQRADARFGTGAEAVAAESRRLARARSSRVGAGSPAPRGARPVAPPPPRLEDGLTADSAEASGAAAEPVALAGTGEMAGPAEVEPLAVPDVTEPEPAAPAPGGDATPPPPLVTEVAEPKPEPAPGAEPEPAVMTTESGPGEAAGEAALAELPPALVEAPPSPGEVAANPLPIPDPGVPTPDEPAGEERGQVVNPPMPAANLPLGPGNRMAGLPAVEFPRTYYNEGTGPVPAPAPLEPESLPGGAAKANRPGFGQRLAQRMSGWFRPRTPAAGLPAMGAGGGCPHCGKTHRHQHAGAPGMGLGAGSGFGPGPGPGPGVQPGAFPPGVEDIATVPPLVPTTRR